VLDNFLKLSSENRNKEVTARRLCINCLRSTSHQAKDCKSSTCQTCNKKYNTLLHMQKKSTGDAESTNQYNQTSKSGIATLNHYAMQNKYYQVILSTAIVNAYDRDGNPHKCRILLDSGSQSNFITEDLAKKLNLVRKQVNMSVTRINKSQANSTYTISVQISSVHTSFSQHVECHILDIITENLLQTYVNINHFKVPNNIRLADPQFHVPNRIDMLIGAEVFWHLICVG